MREIIFRGKRKDNSEWVYGNLVKTETLSFIAFPQSYNEGGLNLKIKEVIPETVGQYTGLCDRYGRKVYEGDIISFKYLKEYIKSPVLFSQKINCFCVEIYKPYDFSFNESLSCDIVIVGNIHNNSHINNELKPCPFCGKNETVWCGTNSQSRGGGLKQMERYINADSLIKDIEKTNIDKTLKECLITAVDKYAEKNCRKEG